jgi:transcriptional regulator with XRE-family HTH domain
MIDRPAYDVAKLRDDMARRGWNASRLAEASGLSNPTVSKFLKRTTQTEKVAKELAKALGFSVARYLIRSKADEWVRRRYGRRSTEAGS